MSERYADIISRLERATGADRELDAEIECQTLGSEIQWRTTQYTMEQYPVARRPSANHFGGFAIEHVPQYTASLDAAIGLVERLAPEFCRSTGTRGNGAWQPGYWAECGPYRKPVDTTHASEPIALLLALFKALQAQEPK